jgi:hypothetical protein
MRGKWYAFRNPTCRRRLSTSTTNADPSFSFHVGIPFSNSAQVQKRYDAPKRSRNSPRITTRPLSQAHTHYLTLDHCCCMSCIALSTSLVPSLSWFCSPSSGRMSPCGPRSQRLYGRYLIPESPSEARKNESSQSQRRRTQYTAITMTERCVESESIGFWQLASQKHLQK